MSGWSSCPTFSGVERCATACRLPRPLMSPHWLRRTWWPGGDLDIAPSQRKNGAGARRRHPRRAALRLKNISKGISCCHMLLSKLQNVTGTAALGHSALALKIPAHAPSMWPSVYALWSIPVHARGSLCHPSPLLPTSTHCRASEAYWCLVCHVSACQPTAGVTDTTGGTTVRTVVSKPRSNCLSKLTAAAGASHRRVEMHTTDAAHEEFAK